ncbi:DUF2345 domain-containing protein, partial [Limnohabitans sp. Jir72]|uniref:DUF2345 domain-containing protein n=1 Tax=Limnohabitans sp. Jir72 TaxID=1977909 RepID=UPI000DD21073
TEGKFPELSEPHLVLTSPAGIESTTPQSTHQHSGQHHAITSGGHTSVSAGKSWLVSAKEAIRLFAYKAGMKLIAAGSDIEIKSLSQNIQLLAKLDITHTANRIELSAQNEVLVNGGGSYTRWSASGIESGTSGSWVAHAANHSMSGGKRIPVVMPQFPVVQEPAKFHIQFRALHNNTGRLVGGAPYCITLTDGQTFFGKTDAKGMTELITLATAQDAQLEWLTHHEDTLSSEEQDSEGC